jgi:Domain of unknown function (DUF4388)
MLEGSLDTFPLPSVLRLLDDTGQTGRLSVHAALGQGALLFDGGRLIDADGPGDDALEAALALFDHRNGTFSFRNEAPGENTLNLEVGHFLELVDEREAAWAEIRQSIPQDGPLFVVPLELTDRADGEVTVSTEAWKIAVLANGRTTNQLAALATTTEFRACSVLLELLQAGLIGFRKDRQGRTPEAPAVQSFEPDEPEASEPEPDAETPGADDAELDPEMLLRELGESGAPEPAPTRQCRLTRR